MKNISYALLLLLFVACAPVETETTARVLRIVGQIEGKYELVSATITEPVDLYGDGSISTDILGQMKNKGWWYGDYCIDGEDPMDSNIILPVLTVNGIGQANFYVPYPVRPDYFPDDNRCAVGLGCYQFHYSVNKDGQLLLDCPEDEIFMNGISLHNIKVSVIPEAKEVIISAITNYFDLSREGWFGGEIQMTYQQNRAL